MKKIVSILGMFTCILLITSCGSDDDALGNFPPIGVSDIQANLVEGTMVRISWEPSVDVNNDVISYDLVVNNVVLVSKTTETFLEFDASQFLTVSNSVGEQNTVLEKDAVAKGLNLELEIQITAFDPNGGVSEEVMEVRSVFVNREPGEFAFNYINFDFFQYDWIDIAWSLASDEDGDILSYDLFINDVVIRENYVIGSDFQEGRVFYSEGFEEFIDEELIIKVIANDRSGGTREIIEAFNFRETDVDLGVLPIPFEDEIQLEILNEEPDRKIRYRFVIEENTGYSFSVASFDFNLDLRDENGNFIASGGSNLGGPLLGAGVYYLSVTTFSGNSTVSGSLTFILRDFEESDQDLGIISSPFSETFSYNTTQEGDRKIVYSFTVNNTENYDFEIISATHDTFLRLFDTSGSVINSDDDGGSGTLSRMRGTLSPGTYAIEVSGFGSSVGTGTLSVQLQ